MKLSRSTRVFVVGLLVFAVFAVSAAAETSWNGGLLGAIESMLGISRPDSSDRATTASNGKILFSSGFGASATIYITDPADGNDTQLAPGTSPVWSPDGSTIMFVDPTSQPDDYSYEIKMMNADGTNPHSLATRTYISLAGGAPSWSPDGTKILFAQKSCGACTGQFDSPFDTDIYVANADGSNQVQITKVKNRSTQVNRAYNPKWQPVISGGQVQNGKIAFTEDIFLNGRNYQEIFTMPSSSPCLDDASCHPTNLSNNPHDNASGWSNDDHPGWSPDGTKLVFQSNRDASPGAFGDIYVMDANGTVLQRVTNDNYDDVTPTFSPDGTQIAWASGYRPGTGGNDFIFVMPANGNPASITSQREVAFNHWGDTPSWGPAGAASCFAKPLGMTAWYPGEGDENDASGNGNNGTTLDGVTFSPGKVGQAFTFSGINSGVQIPDSPNNKPAALTVDTWVKFSSLSNNLQYLVFKKNSRDVNFEGYSLHKDRSDGLDKFVFVITAANAQQASLRSTTPITTGVWYHVAGTYDGTTASLYVNGALEASAPSSITLDYGTRPLFFGTSGESFDGKLTGMLDEVHIFDHALTAAEVQSIYEAGTAGICPPAPSPSPTPTPNPTPVINSDGTGLSPATAVAGSGAFTLTVNGTGFVSNSKVNFNGSERTTTYVSDTKLTAQITSADVATVGTFPITVVNPAPGGGTSNSVDFSVAAMTLSYDGRLRDRVSKSETGLCFNTATTNHIVTTPICDGDPDGTFTMKLGAAYSSKSITKVDVVGQNGNRWDTTPGNGLWVVGVARGLDADFENQADGSLNAVPVSNQGTFKLFVPDSNPSSFVQGKTFTLNLTFNDSSTLSATATVQESPVFDTGVTLRGPSGTITAGDRFSYYVSVQNFGTALATNLHFTDHLPSNVRLVGIDPTNVCPATGAIGQTGAVVSCSFNQLDPGQATTIVLTVQAISGGTNFANSATVSAQAAEPAGDTHPNTASVQSTIAVPTDLAITMTGPTKAATVDTITYNVAIVNNSDVAATGVVFTADIPNDATFVSVDQNGFGCVGAGTTFQCNFPFQVDGHANLHILFSVKPVHSNDSTTIVTKGHITSTNPDSNLLNNDASAPPVSVKVGSDLSVVLQAPTQVSDGSDFDYAIRITNNGPSQNSEVLVTDIIPSNVRVVSFNPGPGSSEPKCAINLIPKVSQYDPDALQCRLGSLQLGQTYQVTLTVHPLRSGTINNSVTVGFPAQGNDADGNLANNRAQFATQTCVNGSGSAPVFQAPEPAKLAPAGLEYTYKVRAFDNNQGAKINYSLAQAPSGMTITNMSDGSALIRWTPNSSLINQAQSVSLLASVVSSNGTPLCNALATKDFSVTVTQPPPVGGYCITNGLVKLCSDAIVPASGQNSALYKKMYTGQLKPEDYPSGTYNFGGNTKIGNILFTGTATVIVDRTNATLTINLSGGSLILTGLPIVGDKVLWTGSNLNFTFDANGKLTNILQDSASKLQISGCQIVIRAAHLLLTDPSNLGINIDGDLIIPNLGGISSHFTNLTLQAKSPNIKFDADFNFPKIDIGGAFTLKNARLSYHSSADGQHDVFSGGGTLTVPGMTVAADATLIGGALDSVCASANFGGTGVPIPPFFNLSGGGAGIVGLRGGPVPDVMCDDLHPKDYGVGPGFSIFVFTNVTIANPELAKVIKLSNAGLIYTAPNKVKIISDLDILSTRAASAVIGMDAPYSVSIGASVSLVDKYPVFVMGGRTLPDGTRAPLFSAGARDDGTGHLSPFMSASAEAVVQIPPMPDPELPQPGPALYGLATVGCGGPHIGPCLHFPVKVAGASVGFDYPPGSFSASVTFPIIQTVSVQVQNTETGILTQLGTQLGPLPPIRLVPNSEFVTKEQTAKNAKSKDKGPKYLPGREGLHVAQSEAAVPVDLGSYTVAPQTPQLLIDLQAGGGSVRYDLIAPDSTVITPDNAAAANITFVQNDNTGENFYAINNPSAGTWAVRGEDGTQGPFTLNVFGANNPPVINSVAASQTDSNVQINYDAADSDDDATVSLYYSKSSTDTNGTLIASGLAESAAGSYLWNTADGTVPTGDYYVYALASDGKNTPVTRFASTKITVVDPLAPATPQNVQVVATTGNSVAVTWDADSNPNIKGYTIQYGVDAGPDTVLDQSFDAAAGNTVRLPRLDDNTTYRVAVVAYSQTTKPDPDHPGTDLTISHLSLPSASQTVTTGFAVLPVVKISAPNGSEDIQGNTDLTVSWDLVQDSGVITQMVDVSTDGGTTYTPIASTLDGTARNYIWHIPSRMDSHNVKIRVTAIDSSGNFGVDTSDAAFSIDALPIPSGTISGRVVTPDGRGIRNAKVTVTDANGFSASALTSSLGFFNVQSVPLGSTYTVKASSKAYRFRNQTVDFEADATLPDFTGIE